MAASGRRLHREGWGEDVLVPPGGLLPRVGGGRLNLDSPSVLLMGSEDRGEESVPPPAAHTD